MLSFTNCDTGTKERYGLIRTNLVVFSRTRSYQSLDGKYFCVGGLAGAVYIYSLVSNKLVTELNHKRSRKPIRCCAFKGRMDGKRDGAGVSDFRQCSIESDLTFRSMFFTAL